MEPIFSFIDHPTLQFDRPTRLYIYADGLYWATDEGLYAIEPQTFRYTNLGDPFRELARLDFNIQPAMRSDSIDIRIADAARLFEYLNRTGYLVAFDRELSKHHCFKRAESNLTRQTGIPPL